MKTKELIDDYIAKTDNINSQKSKLEEEQARLTESILPALARQLQKDGIVKLGLWSESFQQPEYLEEDEALFSKLNPQFCYLSWRVGPIAVTVDNFNLNIIYLDADEDQPVTVSAMDVADHPKNYPFDIESVLRTVAASIEFNLKNKIPVEKWGIAHNSYIDPYTYTCHPKTVVDMITKAFFSDESEQSKQ